MKIDGWNILPDGRGRMQMMGELANNARKLVSTSFSAYCSGATIATTAEKCVMTMRNTDPANYLVVDKVNCNADVAGKFAIKKGVYRTAEGAAVSPFNLNMNQSYVGDIEVYKRSQASTEMTLAGSAVEICGERIVAGGKAIIDFEDALIIPNGQCFGVYFAGAAPSHPVVDVRYYSEGV